MVKLEKLSKPALTALFVLAVFLFAVFALSTNASADGVDTTAAVETESATSVMSVFEGIGLKNTEYPDANFINFLLCLHGYEKLPADATVTVTAYLPVTNTVFWRSTFDKAYLTFKDIVNPVGHGSLLRLPADCVIKIEVNGADIDGWDLIVELMNPDSITVKHGYVEPALAAAKPGDKFQFMRILREQIGLLHISMIRLLRN